MDVFYAKSEISDLRQSGDRKSEISNFRSEISNQNAVDKTKTITNQKSKIKNLETHERTTQITSSRNQVSIAGR